MGDDVALSSRQPGAQFTCEHDEPRLAGARLERSRVLVVHVHSPQPVVNHERRQRSGGGNRVSPCGGGKVRGTERRNENVFAAVVKALSPRSLHLRVGGPLQQHHRKGTRTRRAVTALHTRCSAPAAEAVRTHGLSVDVLATGSAHTAAASTGPPVVQNPSTMTLKPLRVASYPGTPRLPASASGGHQLDSEFT